MKKLNLLQGSTEWHEHRATVYNASDAPAMLGISKYKSRDQLIKERATGIIAEVDNATQKRFNDGHRFEELARDIAQNIIGDDLSPVVGAEGKLSASFDGINFDGSIIFEHKTLNLDLRSAFLNGEIPECYRAQMEQQLMVSGADKCLFMGSVWSDENTLLDESHCWYESDQSMRERIMHGWGQFAIDVENYVHVEVIDAPDADAIQSLPAVTIQVSGEMTLCNLDDVTPKFDAFLAKAESSKEGVSIQNGDAIAKFSRAAAVDCKLTAKSVVSQMVSVNEAVTKLEMYAKKFDTMGLAYEKEVDRLKEIEKVAALNKAKSEYTEYVAALQAEIVGIKLNIVPVDFALAIKGLKTVESKNNALNTALANGKIAADAVAKDYRAKLAWCKEHAAGQSALFPDLQQIIVKPFDDFCLLITSRIEKQKADEAARIEAQRVAMQAAADKEAKDKADAILAAERKAMEDTEKARVAAEVKKQMEEQAATRAEQQKIEDKAQAEREFADKAAAQLLAEAEELKLQQAAIELKPVETPMDRQTPPEDVKTMLIETENIPSALQLIDAVSLAFGVNHSKSVFWLNKTFGDMMYDEFGNRSIFDDVDK